LDSNCAAGSYTGTTNSATALAHGTDYQIGSLDQNYTQYNASKATQFDEDLAWFKSAGRFGTHNVKFGYQLHRNMNKILQGYNEPEVQIFPGIGGVYTPTDTQVGYVNCGNVPDPTTNPPTPGSGIEGKTGYDACVGTYGTINVNDYGTSGQAVAMNHAFFAQDAWTIGHGVTVNIGLRLEHENLPAENQPITQKITTPISFGWGSKVAPRIGVAWDVFGDGKAKIFAGYGKFFDQMKLNLAIGSYGGEIWEECYFGLMQNSLTGITPAYNSGGTYCTGDGTSATVNWASGSQPAGVYYLESQNERANPTTCATCSVTEEGTAPNLKPYSQHDSNFGVDYQIKAKPS
jgi:hypothetical protein